MTGPPADSFVFPASLGQERLWFLSQLDGSADDAYHIACAFRLVGDLDPEHVERSLQAVVDRHESLRTTLCLLERPEWNRSGPQLCQVIAPRLRAPVLRVDLSGLPAEDRPAAAAGVVAEVQRTAFDLERGPLLRADVVREADRRHLLVLCVHHLVADGWSLGLLCRDFATGYAALVEGRTPELPPPPLQFADFAAWQREMIETPEYERHLAYWLSALSGVPPLELPTGRPRPPRQTYHGRRLPFTVPAGLTAAAERLGRGEGATLFMVILAAFQAVLGCWAGQSDFAVGTPIAGRPRPELDEVVGFFANTLAIRADLDGEPKFRKLLRRVRARALEAFEHQAVDFAHLVERLEPQRSLSRPPVFQAFLALQNLPAGSFGLEGLSVEPVELPASSARFDLSLHLHPREAGLEGWFDYDVGLLTETEVGRLAHELLATLESAVRDPDERLVIEERKRTVVPPTPAVAREGGGDVVLARTETERRLADVFRTILGGDGELDVRSNFFALGGTSVNAVLLVAELEREFGVALPVEVVFQYPSIEELAAGLDASPATLHPGDDPALVNAVESLWQEEVT